jgi:hypothetical protein
MAGVDTRSDCRLWGPPAGRPAGRIAPGVLCQIERCELLLQETRLLCAELVRRLKELQVTREQVHRQNG